jgi:hypothetical protein
MKAYLLVFNHIFVDRDALTKFLDSRPVEIRNWFTCFTHAVFIVSESTLAELQALIHAQYPLTFFVITSLDPNSTEGWMPKATWDAINNPRPSGQ